ncbi:carbohydrate-binding protein [Paenibacillus massiliensis]|uniref:carbohydrate-binding protein n=1 Tax=Paenibacillus massiliensis TaxID=225917 RepID=UPI0009DF33F3|nr:carbohydrate-binding protein [Paenibacillus massiliensis]
MKDVIRMVDMHQGIDSSVAVDGTTGVPLGGFGTGAIKFCAHQGTFSSITQAPADQNDYTPMPETKFQLFVTRAGTTQSMTRMKARRNDGRFEDDAIWPMHKVRFEDVNRIHTHMTAFAPLDHSNHVLMSLPYAFYEFALYNDGDDVATVTCAFQTDTATDHVIEHSSGYGFVSKGWSILADSNATNAAITVGGDEGLGEAGGCQGALSQGIVKVAVTIKLAAHDTKRIRFVIAWYDDTDPERAFYLNDHHDSGSIAEFGLIHFDALRSNADRLVTRMRQSNLPSWLTNQTLNTLVNLTNNSMYKKDGRVAFAEGEWTCFGTMDQMWHARQIVNYIAPYFAWQELRYWARTQKANGQIHHDFNSRGPDKSVLVGWDDQEHLDYRNIEKWVDLNAGFIISVHETFEATADQEQLGYFWPFMKKAARRILEQVEMYGSSRYPFTFEHSENSYDAGGDPNPYNAGLTAVAYLIMIRLGALLGEDMTVARYQETYDTVVASFRARYLHEEFPIGRGCESYFAGQWLALHLKLGEVWTAEETDRVLARLDDYYHPCYWGLGHIDGTYNEWTPYLLIHYGGLLLNTRRASHWETMQRDAYRRQYANRNYVFDHPLDILPAVAEPVYPATHISGGNQYISMPGIWRNYYDIVGYRRNQHTREIWVEPILLAEMEHSMVDAMLITTEGYGTISCIESGACHQNKEIILAYDQPTEVSSIYLTDHYGEQVEVLINGESVEFTRIGDGYGRKLVIDWNGIIGNDGIRIVSRGDVGYEMPATPPKPATGADGAQSAGEQMTAYEYIEAESASESAGVTLVTPVGGAWYVSDCHNFDYIKFNNVVFEEVGTQLFLARVSSSVDHSRIDIVLDRVGGDVIGSCPIPNTGGEQAWTMVECRLKKTTGIHNLILKFFGQSEGDLVNIDKFKFVQDDGRLDRTGWTVRASRGNLNASLILQNTAEGWSANPQKEGDYLLIDMKTIQTFDHITLLHPRGEHAEQYAVYVGDDVQNVTACIATGQGETTDVMTRISFGLQRARFLKLILLQSQAETPWTVQEVNVWRSR